MATVHLRPRPWQDTLTLCGCDPDDVQAIGSLRKVDPEAVCVRCQRRYFDLITRVKRAYAAMPYYA